MGPTICAFNHKQPSGGILLEQGSSRFAHLTGYVLLDILPQQTLTMLWQVTSLQNELAILALPFCPCRCRAGNGTLCPKLREYKLNHMLNRPLHHAADLREVHPRDFLDP